jgi:hypothetical protein
MKIIGIDISKNVATCCMLESAPANLKEYSQSKEFVWWHIHPCAEDMEAIAALKPDLIVYEPTGGKYDEAFAHWFRARGFDCRKVAGRRLARYRSEKGLGKNDHLDALSMASYGQEKHQEPSAWIPKQGQAIARIREQWLQRMSLVRQRASLVNRIRLQLAREFPEAMDFVSIPEWVWGGLEPHAASVALDITAINRFHSLRGFGVGWSSPNSTLPARLLRFQSLRGFGVGWSPSKGQCGQG